MRIDVSTLAFTPALSNADCNARELIMVASMPIWSPLTRSKPRPAPCKQAAEYVAAADHYSDLDAGRLYTFYLFGIRREHLRRESEAAVALQRLAAEFEQDSMILHTIRIICAKILKNR